MKSLNLKKNSWYANLYKYMFLRTNENLPQDFCSFFKGLIFSIIFAPFFFLSKINFILIRYLFIRTRIYKILANLIEIFSIIFVCLIYLDIIPKLSKIDKPFILFFYFFAIVVVIFYAFIIFSISIANILNSFIEKPKFLKFIIAIRDMLKKACSKINWD